MTAPAKISPAPTPAARLVQWLPTLAFAALTPLLFADVLFDDSRLPSAADSDLTMQFIAWRDFGFSQMAAGHVPLWNPHIFGGTPYMASFQSALFYPLNWIHLLPPLGLAISWYCAIHTFLMGCFTGLWARYRGCTLAGQTLAGVMMMFCGQFILRVYAGHLPHLAAMVWVPLLFLALDALADGRSWRWALLGVLALALQILSGHPQYVFYTAMALGLYCGVRTLFTPHRFRVILGLAGIYTAAILLTSIQLLPGLEAASENIRTGGLMYRMAAQFSAAPQQWLTFMSPFIFGDLSISQFAGRAYSTSYWGHGYAWELCFFVGLTGLVMGIVGLCKSTRANRIAVITVMLVLALLAAGRYTPVHGWLCTYLPLFGSFRAPAKFLFFVSLLVALSAAQGLSALQRSPSPNLLKRTTLGTLAGAGGLLIGAAVLWLTFQTTTGPFAWLMQAFAASPDRYTFPADYYSQNAEFRSAALRAMLVGLTLAAATLLLLSLLLHLLRRTPRAALGILTLGVVELTAFAFLSRTSTPNQLTYPPQWAMDVQNNPEQYRSLHLQYKFDNAAMSLGSFSLWGYDPGVLLRYGQVMAASQHEPATQYVHFQDAAPFDRLYRMFRLRWIFSATPQPMALRLDHPLKQVQLIGQAKVIADPDVLIAQLLDPNFDPANIVYLEEPPAIPPAGHEVTGDARVISQDTDTLEIQATTPEPAILLVTDNYAKGWRVRAMDGSSQKQYQLLPANHCLRGIPLSAGRHHLILEYSPAGWLIGRWITAVSLTAFALVAIWALASGPTRPTPGGRNVGRSPRPST